MLPTAALSGPSLSRTHEQHASASSCCCTRRRQALINIPLIAKNTENKATHLMLSRANTHGPVGRLRPTCFQIGHQGRHGQVGQDTLVLVGPNAGVKSPCICVGAATHGCGNKNEQIYTNVPSQRLRGAPARFHLESSDCDPIVSSLSINHPPDTHHSQLIRVPAGRSQDQRRFKVVTSCTKSRASLHG